MSAASWLQQQQQQLGCGEHLSVCQRYHLATPDLVSCDARWPSPVSHGSSHLHHRRLHQLLLLHAGRVCGRRRRTTLEGNQRYDVGFRFMISPIQS